MQIEAARIVSGVTRSISLNTLYKAIGWLTLDDTWWQKNQKSVLTFKIKKQHGSWLPEWSFSKVCWKSAI